MEITDDKWNEIDGKVISDLHLALTNGVLSSVAEKNTAKEIWDTLTKLYEAKSLHHKIFLKRKLYTLRMTESTMVTDHINTLKTLFSQLTTLGHNIEENERAELLLQSLPDSYDQLIINLMNNNPVDSIVFDDVAASVLNKESRRKNKENRQASSQQAEALLVTRGRLTERGPSGSQNHGRSKSRRGSVYMGDDHALEIAGICAIKIKMFDGTIRTIGEEANACVALNGEESKMMWHLKLGHMSEQERMSRTLTERIRAMLRTAGLPNSFWAEAVKTAYYIVNRSPSTTIGLKTAMEMWTGKPADYSYLHAFGCPVYVMYNTQERTKLDPKSRRCIFLRYADGVKRYRLWDPTAHKIVISRDVIFIEDQLQMRDEDDSSVKEKSETIPVYVENNLEDSDSSEAAPEHEEQEPVESKAPEVRQSTRERRPPTWHSEYVTEINVAYCLLTEDEEPSTFHEVLKELKCCFVDDSNA
ncbi:hypothetical protein KPL71_024696 [Citrus sinensis]|uniref:Uncharacterized protein n=1 Tax=Citrus sinensis TaxID=2711 RepID=A0ACB8ITK6_CITSI|nr:hypothetical protein KPL71_024696 [Citrus sinensis]